MIIETGTKVYFTDYMYHSKSRVVDKILNGVVTLKTPDGRLTKDVATVKNLSVVSNETPWLEDFEMECFEEITPRAIASEMDEIIQSVDKSGENVKKWKDLIAAEVDAVVISETKSNLLRGVLKEGFPELKLL